MLWVSERRLHWKWSAVWASVAPGTLLSSAGSCPAGIARAAACGGDHKCSAESEEMCGCFGVSFMSGSPSHTGNVWFCPPHFSYPLDTGFYAICYSGQDAFKRVAWTLASLSMREPGKQSRLVPVFLLPHRKTSALSTSSRLDFSLHHQLYRGRGKGDVACWEVIAVAPFDWALHYVEWRTLLFTERHPRKLQSMVEKNLGF